MSLLDGLRHRLGVLFGSQKYARELEEEFEFHRSLDAMQQEHGAPGDQSPEEARWAARRRFGNETNLTEEARQMAGLGFFNTAAQDLRFAWRSFQRTPGFTAVVILTLAVGIGANTAIFSAVNAMLLRPLPFREPDQLMTLSLTIPARNGEPARTDLAWSYPKFAALRDAQTAFEDVALSTDAQFTVRMDGEAERDYGEMVGARYLPILGITPMLGRNFLPEEDLHPDAPHVVLLSDGFWQRRFNADPAVLGTSLNLNGTPYTVVGVLPKGFKGLTGRAELLTPVMTFAAEEMNQAWNHMFSQIGRRKAGVSAEQARAQVVELGRRVDQAYPHPERHDEHWGAMARPLDDTRVDPVIRRSLLVLLGAVGLVLLIACANVANLFLVRATGRRREIAVRLAIGAGRGRLVRQLLTESLLLATLGGLASLALAWIGVKLLAAANPANALRLAGESGLGAINFGQIRLDGAAFGFAALLALGTGLLFGLIPALQGTRPVLTEALKEGGQRTPGGVRHRWSSRNSLVIAEIALALVLLAGSGLMLKSLARLLDVDLGLNPEGVLTLRFNAREGFGRDSLPEFYDRLQARLEGIPGVSGVALSDCPPLSGGCNGTSIVFRDRPPVTPGSEPDVGVHWITPGWPTIMGMPLIKGRAFDSQDRLGRRKSIIVNQTAARTFWPGQDPIGRPVSVGQGGFWEDTAYVVGVVGDLRYTSIDSPPVPDAYLSFYQSPRGRAMLFIRSSGDPLALVGAVRAALKELAPDFPVYDVTTLSDRVATASSYARFSTVLLSLFALVALGLATMGTYGVMAFAVSQRTQEIGIRMALGATRGDVVRLVIRQGIGLAATGAVIGLAAAIATTRVLGSLLFDVAPSDPATFGTIVVVLLLAVLGATWLPARRAATIQPTEALRGS